MGWSFMFVPSDPEGRVARTPGQMRVMKRLNRTRGVSDRGLLTPTCIQEKEHAVGTAVWLQRSCFRGRQDARCEMSHNEGGPWDDYQLESGAQQMSCHTRTVECLSEALASLRWAHEEGLSPRHSPPRARTAAATCSGSGDQCLDRDQRAERVGSYPRRAITAPDIGEDFGHM